MSTVSQIIQSPESQQYNPYDDLKLRISVCDIFFRQQCSRNYYIEQLQMIRSQSQLMEQIRNGMITKKISGENYEEDRETTRDPEISILSHARSTGRLHDSHSPSCSFVSSCTSIFRRNVGQSDATDKLLKEVERKCSMESTQLLRRILTENQQAKAGSKQNRKLKSELLKIKQEIDQVKQRDITNTAKLYETTKKLQAYEIKISELRDKREEYNNKLADLDTRQMELNKAQINCMVRERLAKNQTAFVNEWSNSASKYKQELSILKQTIEQLVASPQSFSYRSLADTIVTSLEGQESELEQQGSSLKKLTERMEQLLRSTLKG